LPEIEKCARRDINHDQQDQESGDEPAKSRLPLMNSDFGGRHMGRAEV
jgi:hypothetical protein